MQSVTTAFSTAAAAAANSPDFSLSISWLKTYNVSAVFFKIGTSLIGGTDPIPSGAGAPTYFDKYSYTEETNAANSVTVERVASTIPIGIMSAQLDAEFDNTSKRYLPTYDATIGAYIKPGRPIRLNIGFSNELVQQFIGLTGRPRLTLVNRVLSLHAFDSMDYLNNFESQLDMQSSISVSEMIKLLLIEAGFSSSQYSIEPSVQEAVKFIAPAGKKTGTLIRALAESELGLFFFNETGVATYWSRHHTNNNATSVATLNYSNMTDIQFIDTPVINHVKVITKPRQLAAYQPVWTLAGSLTVPPGGNIKHLGSFTDDQGELPVNNITTPTYTANDINDSYYSTNTQEDGQGLANSSAITLVNFDTFGTSFSIEFSNSSSSPMYISDLAIYGYPAKVIGQGIVQEYKDQTSIDDNGLNPDDNSEVKEITNNYIQNSNDAYVYAKYIVKTYAQPRRQLMAPVFPNPAYQFGDVMTVNIADTGESLKCVVMGTKIGMDQRTVIEQALTLENRTFNPYFKIGTSSIQGTDEIAP